MSTQRKANIAMGEKDATSSAVQYNIVQVKLFLELPNSTTSVMSTVHRNSATYTTAAKNRIGHDTTYGHNNKGNSGAIQTMKKFPVKFE